MARVTIRRATLRKTALAALLAAAFLAMAAPPAGAHNADQAYLYLDVGDDELHGRVELPYQAMREVLGLELAGSPDEVVAELQANLPAIRDYLHRHTAVGAGGEEWALAFESVRPLFHDVRIDGGGFAIFPLEAEVPGATVPQELELRFDPFLDEIDGRSTLVLLGNDWRRGVFDEEANTLVVLDAGNRTAVVDLGEASQWTNFTASVRLGVDHIRSGLDHILFVFVLLLPSVLVFALAAWRPAPTFGKALWRVLKIVTMFTIAHSITFSLAGLDLLPLPPARFVETVIGLSIVAAALYNLRPVFGDKEWVIAFAFGLFHGMGFALLVESLTVDRATRLVSLLGRNLGIEIGQAVVVLLVFPALFLLRRTRYYRPLFVVGSLGLAGLGTVWVVERGFEVNLRTQRLGTELAGLPFAVLVLAAVAVTAVAALAYRAEARAGRLAPLELESPGAVPGESLAYAEA